MLLFAVKSLSRNKTRTGLTVLGLAVAVMGVVSLLSISEGLRESVISSLEKVQLVLVTSEDAMGPSVSVLDESLMSDVQRVEGARTVAEAVIYPVVVGEERAVTTPVFAMGIDPGQDKSMKNPVISGGLVAGSMFSGTSGHKVLLSKKIADKYKKKVGDTITINGVKYKVTGITDPKISILNSMVFVPLDTAKQYSGKGQDKVSVFFVEPEDPEQASALARRIELSVSGVSANTVSEMAGTAESLLAEIDAFFVLISSFSIVVGALIVMNTLYMNVLDRTAEIGVLRAMGWTKDDVMKEVMLESFVLGIMISGAGIALSHVLKYAVLDNLLTFPTTITPWLMLAGFLLAVTVSLLGGVYPAMKAAGVDPVTAIRTE